MNPGYLKYVERFAQLFLFIMDSYLFFYKELTQMLPAESWNSTLTKGRTQEPSVWAVQIFPIFTSGELSCRSAPVVGKYHPFSKEGSFRLIEQRKFSFVRFIIQEHIFHKTSGCWNPSVFLSLIPPHIVKCFFVELTSYIY